MIELGLFRNRAFVVGLATSLSFCGGLSAFFLSVTLFLQHGLGFSPTAASLAFAPFALGYLAVSGAAVKLTARLGSRVINVGTALMAGALVALIVLARALGSGLGEAQLLPVLLAYGLGQGLAMPTLIRAALAAVPAEEAGSASGVLATVQQVAFSLGVAVIGSVFFTTLEGSGPSPAGYADAVATTLLCNVGLLGLTFALACWLPRSAGGGEAVVEVEKAPRTEGETSGDLLGRPDRIARSSG